MSRRGVQAHCLAIFLCTQKRPERDARAVVVDSVQCGRSWSVLGAFVPVQVFQRRIDVIVVYGQCAIERFLGD